MRIWRICKTYSNHGCDDVFSFDWDLLMASRCLRCLALLSMVLMGPALADDDGARYTRFAGFQLGSGTLADVEQQLGSANVVTSGDAGEYTASICYRTARGYVTFLSGEMGGGSDLLGFTVSRTAARPPCAKWPARMPAPQLALPRASITTSLMRGPRSSSRVPRARISRSPGRHRASR